MAGCIPLLSGPHNASWTGLSVGSKSVAARVGQRSCSPRSCLPRGMGTKTFSETLGRVKCGRCGNPPESVYLCAGNRTQHGGPPADWAIELLAPSR